jgi:ElaB/YqjD/DUF883 family membrane-anchored ribosome-binding protein
MMISGSKDRPASIHGNGRGATSLATSASEMAQQAEERLAGVAEIVKTVVMNRPVMALGAALAAGVFLGWLIKRR